MDQEDRGLSSLIGGLVLLATVAAASYVRYQIWKLTQGDGAGRDGKGNGFGGAGGGGAGGGAGGGGSPAGAGSSQGGDERPPNYSQLLWVTTALTVVWLLRAAVMAYWPSVAYSPSSPSSPSSTSAPGSPSSSPSPSLSPVSAGRMSWSRWLLEVGNVALLAAWPYAVYATMSVGASLRYPTPAARRHLARTALFCFSLLAGMSLGLLLVAERAYFSAKAAGYAVFFALQAANYGRFARALGLMAAPSSVLALRVVFLLGLCAVGLHAGLYGMAAWDPDLWRSAVLGGGAGGGGVGWREATPWWWATTSTVASAAYLVPVVLWVEWHDYEVAQRAQALWALNHFHNHNHHYNAAAGAAVGAGAGQGPAGNHGGGGAPLPPYDAP